MKGMKLLAPLAVFASVALASRPDVWDFKKLDEVLHKLVLEKYYVELTGDTDLAKVYGYSIERTTSGKAARAAVKYIDAEGVKKTQSYFCHVHEGEEIDCH